MSLKGNFKILIIIYIPLQLFKKYNVTNYVTKSVGPHYFLSNGYIFDFNDVCYPKIHIFYFKIIHVSYL